MSSSTQKEEDVNELFSRVIEALPIIVKEKSLMCNLEFGGVLYASLPSQIDGNWEVTVFSEVNGKILRVNIEKSKWGKIRIRSKLFNIVIRIEDLEDPQLKNKVMSHIINELASLFDEGKKQ